MAAPLYAKAQDRLNALNAKVGGGKFTPQQKQLRDELTRRAGIAASQGSTLKEVNQGQKDLAGTATDLAVNRVQEFATPFDINAANAQTDAERKRIEDMVYGNLTRDTDQQEALNLQEVQQSLNARGIPYSADPNSQYQQQMKDHTRRFDDIRSDARAKAVGFGGQEMQRTSDISLGVRNQNLGEVGGLSNLGLEGITSLEQLTDADRDRILAKAIAKMANRSSGSGATTYPTNPFEGL